MGFPEKSSDMVAFFLCRLTAIPKSGFLVSTEGLQPAHSTSLSHIASFMRKDKKWEFLKALLEPLENTAIVEPLEMCSCQGIALHSS